MNLVTIPDDTLPPPPRTALPVTPPPMNNNDADALALAAAVKALARPGLNAAQVADIVTSEIAKLPRPQLDEARVRQIAADVVKNAMPLKVQAVLDNEGRTGPTIQGAHALLPIALSVVSAGIPLLVHGEKGCGKTTLASQLAEALELNFAHISCSAAMTAGKLVGFQNPMNGEQWFRGEVTRHLTAATLVLLDEADAGDPGVQLCLNSILANRYIGEPTGLVRCHDHFVMMLASNTVNGGTRQYNGRQKLDDAMLDRMAILELPLDNAVEASLVGITETSKVNGSLDRGGLASPSEWLANVRAVRNALLAKGLKHAAPGARAVELGGRLLRTLGRHWLNEMFLLRGQSEDIRNIVTAELAKDF